MTDRIALSWLERHAHDLLVHAVDLGGRDTSGHGRHLWPRARWTVVDCTDEDSFSQVDVVADAATWQPDGLVSLVICSEVAEHTPVWPLIVANAQRMLLPGGMFLFTAAGPGRPPHGQTGDTRFRHADDSLVPGWYRNIEPAELEAVVRTVFTDRCEFGQEEQSVFAAAWKP